ncbi:MAG: hypothetical protein RSD96_00085 [Bacilli bacterium]
MDKFNIDFILEDVYKKICLRKLELDTISETEFILNKKYLIKLNDVKSDAIDLIYYNNELNYSVNKYKKQTEDK